MGRCAVPSRSALAVLLGLAGLAAPAFAQAPGPIVRDGSLGNGPLEVARDASATYWITPEMGEQRGTNLFHSFFRFGVGAGETATFTGPDDVAHVISRVTGDEPSQIDGTLRSTIAGADLWLFNPNGVGFGAGAEVDVRGSFHAAAADSVVFGESGLERYHADRSLPSVLATAPPAAFGFLDDPRTAALTVDGSHLEVDPGKTLELVAKGNLSLTGAEFLAPGGHVGLEAVHDVTLAVRDVTLAEHSLVDVGRAGGTPGTVSIRGGKIVIKEGSQVLAENESALPTDPTAPELGSITVEAGEAVVIDDGLLSVNTWGAGDAGTIRIGGLGDGHPSPDVAIEHGPGLRLNPDGSLVGPETIRVGVRAETTSTGRAGVIRIDAASLAIQHGAAVSVDAVGTSERPPHPARGPAGTVEIHADSLDLRDRSFIGAAGWGSTGPAGAIRIDLGEGPLVVDRAGSPYAWIIANSHGSLGTIDIQAGSVAVSNGGQILAACNARCIETQRPKPAAGVEPAPNIRIKADEIRVTSGGRISADTRGEGNAGTIALDADSLLVSDGGEILAMTFAAGNAGTITIGTAESPVEEIRITNARIDAGTDQNASGSAQSGDVLAIDVHAGSLEIRNDGGIQANSRGRGDAGSIRVVATRSIRLQDEGVERFSLPGVFDRSQFSTGVFSVAVPQGLAGGGKGGSVTLDAPEITVSRGAIVAASSLGGKAAGNVELNAQRIGIEDGAIVDSSSLTPERAGNVTLRASESIEVVGAHPIFDDPSYVGSSTLGEGAGGTVSLQAPRIVIDGGSVSTAAVPLADVRQGGAGGDITLEGPKGGPAREILVRGGGRIEASSLGSGDGGTIHLRAAEVIRVEGGGSGIRSRTGADGAGGDLTLTAPTIEVADGGEISARSEPGLGALGTVLSSIKEQLGPAPKEATGSAGKVTLEARTVRVSGGATIATSAESADGGNIEIRASQLVHLIDGRITTSVRERGSGGNIVIDPVFTILQRGSRIIADAGEFAGDGGHIKITAENFFAFPDSRISATSGAGLAGTVEIHSPSVNLSGALAELPSSFLDAGSQMLPRCAARRGGERVGSFAVRGAGGIPAEPDGWLPAPLRAAPDAALADDAAIPGPVLVASLAGPPLVRGACP